MNILVIGGEGFVGSHIVREFIQNDHQVTVFGPKIKKNTLADLSDQYSFIEGDLMDQATIFAALKKSEAEIVIHLAAFGAGSAGLARSAKKSPKKAMDVNVNGFFNLLRACDIMGVRRVIWSSSSTVFGSANQYHEPVEENVPLNPSLFYGVTKVMKEQIGKYFHRETNMEVSGLRLPLLFGPGRWYKGAGGALIDLFDLAENDKSLDLDAGNEIIDLMYAKDLGPLFYKVTMTKNRISPIYNVPSFQTRIEDLVSEVEKLMNIKINLNIIEKEEVYPLMSFDLMDNEINFNLKFGIHESCKDYLKELNKI